MDNVTFEAGAVVLGMRVAASRRLVVNGFAYEEVGTIELQKWKRRASP
ncbi:hypothetical protein M3223_07300 [Paenibacillus pasadenensis]|nr:hypothetical protein [Paenibacillus pasadenensis]MCM3747160.1 hypothetical protein [Paenibacillus pasadenensis]